MPLPRLAITESLSEIMRIQAASVFNVRPSEWKPDLFFFWKIKINTSGQPRFVRGSSQLYNDSSGFTRNSLKVHGFRINWHDTWKLELPKEERIGPSGTLYESTDKRGSSDIPAATEPERSGMEIPPTEYHSLSLPSTSEARIKIWYLCSSFICLVRVLLAGAL